VLDRAARDLRQARALPDDAARTPASTPTWTVLCFFVQRSQCGRDFQDLNSPISCAGSTVDRY
jgi:hypothetical protein